MTDESPQGPTMQVGVQLSTQLAPDGKHWVVIQFDAPLCTFALLMPPDQALVMADNLPEGLKNAARECSEKDSSIIVVNSIEGIPNV